MDSISGPSPQYPGPLDDLRRTGDHQRLPNLAGSTAPTHLEDLPTQDSSASTQWFHGDSSRPGAASFRDDGSIRAGTQLLIQALQAVPWDNEGENFDDWPSSEPMDFGRQTATGLVSSSIHTIHRPVARSRKNTPVVTKSSKEVHSHFSDRPSPLPPEIGDEDSADGGPDFEEQECHVGEPRQATLREGAITSERNKCARSGSLATVRVVRRSRLATKLKEVFEIDEMEELIAEIPCWLLRSVLLRGYMYLTDSYLCFFAHLPSREDQILKSGSLYKKTTRTKRWVKRWFILKNDALSWYQSSSDPYFPHGVVDLKYAVSCEPVSEKDILLKTNEKVVLASADSATDRDEWLKAIRKVIFKAQNLGENVKIAIPYSAILEVDRSSAMEFSDTIEIKVVDSTSDNFTVDSYFFAYFHSVADVLDQLQDLIKASRTEFADIQPQLLRDTTNQRSPTPSQSHVRPAESSSNLASNAVHKSGFRIPNIFKSLGSKEGRYELTNSSDHNKGPTGESNVNTTLRCSLSQDISVSDSHSSCLTTSSYDHTYPPSPSPPNTIDNSSYPWSVSVPSWLKGSSLKLFAGVNSQTTSDTPTVSEVFTQHSTEPDGPDDDHEFDLVEYTQAFKQVIEPHVEDKFRKTFAVDEKEELLGCVQGYVLRVLPVHGTFFISRRHLCFRSSQSIIKTRMMVPIKDIVAAQQCKAVQFGCYGLLLVIKGHEELFFEFRSSHRRALCLQLLEQQIEFGYKSTPPLEPESQRNLAGIILEELEPLDSNSQSESLTESMPGVMFASSTFLSFKPQHPLRFTFLTIGSRGDVQPYIALAKGLMADGHRITIATHLEYKEWINSHGINFASVGGDPAELMRICVENGMFTVSFLKETLTKFRGWLDDLLRSSWEACHDTDVLIESPSAMAGIHIAEALRIPYFRAFTMPWTRTRVYPHAFAVPEHKMGGNYNYMSYVMFDQVFWRATSGQINRWRRDYLGIGPTNLDKMMQHKVPFLYNFSPTVVPPPLDWVEWIRVTGYWFLDDADVASKKWEPPKDLIAFIENARMTGRKIVYIGFGSIVVSDPVAMTECVVKAIEKSGVCAILSKGWSDRLQSKKAVQEEIGHNISIGRQIYEISSAPHDWLFARIDAACHHGGAGTTGASLRAGIPTIIKPFFGDQFFWSERVEALGVGSCIRTLSVDNLSDALLHATTDKKQIERARRLGQAIRAENGIKTAIEAIYRNLEYAKTFAGRRADGWESPRNRLVARPLSPPTSSIGGSRQSEEWSFISDDDETKPGTRPTSGRNLLQSIHGGAA